MENLDSKDVIIKAAAVADYAPAEPLSSKMKKSVAGDEVMLKLRKNPDILEEVARRKNGALLIAFAAETDSVEENARQKLQRKGADFIVANDVSDSSIGFDSDQNEVLIIGRDGSETKLAKASKFVIANQILDLILKNLS
jgi:phosphopantothenoylcysteine decarboxylase/phosphopantothenate--cysteine ligase